MARVCQLCGKKTQVGVRYARRGLAKAKGGVGKRITGKTLRRYKPNIQRVRVDMGGSAKRMSICAKCLKSGRITKRVRAPKAAPAEEVLLAETTPAADTVPEVEAEASAETPAPAESEASLDEPPEDDADSLTDTH